MRSRQQGATFLGMLTIVAILGFGLYAGIRLLPIYLEYFGIVKAMEQVSRTGSGAQTPKDLRDALDRRWAIEDFKSIQPKDMEIKKAPNGGWTMRAWYRAEAPFVGNVSLAVDFDKTVIVGAGGPG
jgi:hypothetical protein